MKFVELATGVRLPLMGFGTFRMKGTVNIERCLDIALATGYRAIDTAKMYGNEKDIGLALKKLLPKYGLTRDDIFITSKTYLHSDGSEIRRAVLEALSDLQVDSIDLYLIHYPAMTWGANTDKNNPQYRKTTWLELEKLKAEGKLKTIGVSNFEIKHIEELKQYSSLTPAVNQCEFHPHLTREKLVEYCKQNGIVFEAFTSLGRNHPDLMSDPTLTQVANTHGVPISQVLLAWAMQRDIPVIPKSETEERIRSNFESINVKLTDQEVSDISALNKDRPYTACQGWAVF